jgi:hypothetical protein
MRQRFPLTLLGGEEIGTDREERSRVAMNQIPKKGKIWRERGAVEWTPVRF